MSDQRIFDFSQKLFCHPEQIVEYKRGNRPFPITMEVDLTNNCNHKCEWCYDLDKHKQQESEFLDTDLIKKRLEEAYQLGTRGLNFSGGGEPMLHKDFMNIIKFCKDAGFDIGVITNGSVISRKNVHQLTELLSWLRVSVAGGDRITYKEIQGVDQFDLVISKVDLLVEVKKNTCSKLVIGVRILVSDKNLHTINGFAERLIMSMAGVVNYLQIAPDQFSTDGGKFWNSLENQKMQSEVREILAAGNIKLLKTGFSIPAQKLVTIDGSSEHIEAGPDELDYPRTCYAHFFQAAITAKGELRFCKNSRGDDRYILGNIKDKSLKEIWDGETNKGIESWVRPNNCGLFCKNMALNKAMEDTLYPDPGVFPNFVN